MSLFIGSLAFDGPEYFTPIRLGVIVGSTLSGVAGYLLLRFAPDRSEVTHARDPNKSIPNLERHS
jgi:Na+:H+ antiporter, NhaA family